MKLIGLNHESGLWSRLTRVYVANKTPLDSVHHLTLLCVKSRTISNTNTCRQSNLSVIRAFVPFDQTALIVVENERFVPIHLPVIIT